MFRKNKHHYFHHTSRRYEDEKFKERFAEEDYQELCELFGLNGAKPNKTQEEKIHRQQFWQGKSIRYADPQMREIATYAVAAYGKL